MAKDQSRISDGLTAQGVSRGEFRETFYGWHPLGNWSGIHKLEASLLLPAMEILIRNFVSNQVTVSLSQKRRGAASTQHP